ncbi:MAG: hypothetical protein JWN25_1862 [Verrucomicrobiales bacterium]|nr:hypothetical protein [Verrucomicrobiales bacterium]MDB6130669.1 hypothetical protein [Verrucomicrobiales bacterium]
MNSPKIVYCHCAYAQVVPRETKEAVLKRLCDSGVEFEATSDLCELSARKDPVLLKIASMGEVKIAACFPRAVKWLFSAAGTELDPAKVQVINMRTESSEAACSMLMDPQIVPNWPIGKASPKPELVEN